MMKVRIIKNAPVGEGLTNISEHIGKIFEVVENSENKNVYNHSIGTIFKDEYEVVDDETEVTSYDKIIEINNTWYSHEELVEIIEKASMYDQLCH